MGTETVVSIEQRLLNLKSSITRLTADRDKAQGAWEQLMAGLKRDYGLESVEEAEAEAERLEKEAGELEWELEGKLAEIGEKYGELLGMKGGGGV